MLVLSLSAPQFLVPAGSNNFVFDDFHLDFRLPLFPFQEILRNY